MQFAQLAGLFKSSQGQKTFNQADIPDYKALTFGRSRDADSHCKSCGSGGTVHQRIEVRKQNGETDPQIDSVG